MADKEFKKDLEKTINEADPRLDKNELLEDVFKISVARLLEHSMNHGSGEKRDRLEIDALMTAKQELIREFRSASLGVYQRSVEQYEKLFMKSMEEIFNDASLSHEGQDEVKFAGQNLEINKDAYVNEGGLFVPSHMKN